MRILEYRQDLFNRGYTVTSGNRHYEEMRGQECLPIRMYREIRSREYCTFFDDLVEKCLCFNYNLDEGTEEEHRKKYADILLGKKPEWIVIAFNVTVGEVYVDLYNTKTKETTFFSLQADELGIYLRFEVPRTDGGPSAIYDVGIEGAKSEEENAHATVTEYINHVRREIKFFHKTSDERDGTYIEVTEYADM